MHWNYVRPVRCRWFTVGASIIDSRRVPPSDEIPRTPVAAYAAPRRQPQTTWFEGAGRGDRTDLQRGRRGRVKFARDGRCERERQQPPTSHHSASEAPWPCRGQGDFDHRVGSSVQNRLDRASRETASSAENQTSNGWAASPAQSSPHFRPSNACRGRADNRHTWPRRDGRFRSTPPAGTATRRCRVPTIESVLMSLAKTFRAANRSESAANRPPSLRRHQAECLGSVRPCRRKT